MDRQQIALRLTLDALGVPVRLDSFADRLTIQKAVYLSQAVGVQLGYNYNWYRRGPYSPGLTRDAFGLVAEIEQGLDESKGSSLDSASLGRLQKLRQLINAIPAHERSSRLELLASVRFLLRTPSGRGKDANQLQSIMLRFGKNYSAQEIQDAIEELNRHGLCPANSSF
jgi:uncharacterized protein YwgA